MAGQVLTSMATSFSNATFGLIPSSSDLLMVVPRLVHKVGLYALDCLPEQYNVLFAVGKSTDGLNANTLSKTLTDNATPSSSGTPLAWSHVMATTASPLPQVVSGSASGFFSSFSPALGFNRLTNVDTLFSYIFSRWAFSTLLILVITQSIVLNRAHVYASARRHLTLNWQTRLILRIVPILMFLQQVLTVLQALRCQTSSCLAQLHIDNPNKKYYTTFVNGSPALHRFSSTLLFWQDDQTSCQKAGMLSEKFIGSSSILWPLFVTLCMSQFIETMSCALQGRQPAPETGMTVFEHSLAFAEAEAVVKSVLGPFDLSKPSGTRISSSSAAVTSAASQLASPVPSVVFRQLNVPHEVLLIALISCFSHLSSHVLGLLGRQAKYRLINTTVWGLCFMTVFLWSFVHFFLEAGNHDVGVLRYSTVCIIAYLPHIMVVCGCVLCGIIYFLALFITMLSPLTPPAGHESILERLRLAHSNMQANVTLANIRISSQDEFFTTLLKVGFRILSSASEAVYFNEGRNLTLSSRTWLEEKKLDEVSNLRTTSVRMSSTVPPELQGDSSVAEGIGLIDEAPILSPDGSPLLSGFARERRTTKDASRAAAAAIKEEGVGGSLRSGRLYMSLKYMKGVFRLCTSWLARGEVALLNRVGIRIPGWLGALTMPLTVQNVPGHAPQQPPSLQFWMLSDTGELSLPADVNVDVELETRKRLMRSEAIAERSEEMIDANLYGWWKNGGWWGELDSSGDYQPRSKDDDEDTTSLCSLSSIGGSVTSTDFDSDDDGRRTPTQGDYARAARATPVREDALTTLAQLLDPKTTEDKEEARLLGRRLQNAGPMTRSQHRQHLHSDNLHLLAGGPMTLPKQALSLEEEEELLEQIIHSRRAASFSFPDPNNLVRLIEPTSWNDGAAGLGSEGPLCVVCRSTPRSILVWPCRCLSLCEECRVSLAMNNFGSCVCCRRDVVAFSRLYVP